LNSKASALIALQHRNFRLLWMGQLISLSGSTMQTAAILWQVALRVPENQKGLALGLVGLAEVKIEQSNDVEGAGKLLERAEKVSPTDLDVKALRAQMLIDAEENTRAEEILNEDHYGLEKIKERILEFLAVRALVKKGVASGEFRETRIAEFPQVLVGPAVLAVVWALILGERQRLDLDAYMEAHLELLLCGLRKVSPSARDDSEGSHSERGE
jgi:hypothetical protein